MSLNNHRWVAALIAAHPGRKIVGRTRLQKEVKLLQRLGFPTDYTYSIHFYGPYSESLQADIGLMEAFGHIQETAEHGQEGKDYYVLKPTDSAEFADVTEFSDAIRKMNKASSVVLELAATYDAFRELGSDHADAILRLRRKKGSKCEGGNENAALELLNQLQLDTE